MAIVKIKINSLEDAKNSVPILDGEVKEINETQDFTVGILEKGTQQGQLSLMFCLKNEDNTHSIAQCTGRQFEALFNAYLGAKQRFNPMS